ncbi:MAG: DUF853 family protein [Mogibacterium sp.]|nr:DUF853 family protein [Mogibacterium sp.]
MVFFFDEAHLLFKNASKSLLEKIEQVVKLIRSKGVSIFFVTQSPGDIPNAVMSQLGNKIEHGLHAYTPAEQKVVRAAADSFRTNPEFDTEQLLLNLGTGEAIVSLLDEKGAPSVAEHAFILPPESRMGPLTDEERSGLVKASFLNSRYETMVDNVSAYEVITGRASQTQTAGTAAGGGYTYSADFKTAADPQTQSAAHASSADTEPAEMQDGQDISFDIELEEPAAKAARSTQERNTKKAAAKKKSAQTRDEDEDSGSAFGDMADNLLGRSGTRQVVRSTGGTIGREVGKAIGEAVLGKKGKTIGGNIGSSIGRNLFGTLLKR